MDKRKGRGKFKKGLATALESVPLLSLLTPVIKQSGIVIPDQALLALQGHSVADGLSFVREAMEDEDEDIDLGEAPLKNLAPAGYGLGRWFALRPSMPSEEVARLVDAALIDERFAQLAMAFGDLLILKASEEKAAQPAQQQQQQQSNTPAK